MAIHDAMQVRMHSLLETVGNARDDIGKALNEYGSYYAGRVSRERQQTLEAMVCLLYMDSMEFLNEDFHKAMLPEREINRLGKHDRLVCLLFLLRGIQCYLGEDLGKTAGFANEVATGKYSMEDLPYPE